MPTSSEAGFSIREYAAKMRTMDVFKSCPFLDDNRGEEDMSKEQAESLLPPITVIKFKLWSRELDLIKSNNHEDTVILTLTNKESNEEIPNNGSCNSTAVVPEPHDQRRRVVDQTAEEEVEEENDESFLSPVREVFESIDTKVKAKSKSKVPKKRSIAEIFAVAPPVQTVEDDDQQTAERKLKAKKIKKRKKEKKVVLLEDTNNNLSNKMKKKEKKVVILEEKKNDLINKIEKKKKKMMMIKENSCKLKRQTPVIFSKKLHKKFGIESSDTVTVRSRTPNMKYLSSLKRKVAQTSKCILKQKKRMPARSILKNNHVFCGKNSTLHRMEGDNQVSTCGTQHSRKHVKFSGMEDILGQIRHRKSSFEHSLFSETLSSSSEKDLSVDSDKDAVPVEVDRKAQGVSIVTDNGTEACSTTGRNEYAKLLDQVDVPSFLRPHSSDITHQEKTNHLLDDSATKVSGTSDNNMQIFDLGYLTSTREPVYTVFPRLVSSVEESCISQGVMVPRDFDSSGKIIDHVVHPIDRISAVSSKENTGGSFEPSMRDFILNESAQGRIPFLSQYARDKIGDHGLHYQSVRPPIDLIDGSHSFAQWKQRPITFTERLLDDKFLGLPLNSHGEFIQFSQRNGSGFDQLAKLDTAAGSSNSLSSYNQHFAERELPSNRLNMSPMQSYVREKHSSQLPDRLGVTCLGSTQRPDIDHLDFNSRSSHSFHPLGSDMRIFNISSSRCRQFDQQQNQNIEGMVSKELSVGPKPLNANQPTMRLMGKDVAIGESNRQVHGFEDGKVWMDKQIIAEHCPSSNAFLSSSMNKNFHQECYPPTTVAKLKETVPQAMGFSTEQVPQTSSWIRDPELNFPHPYQNWQSSSGFEHGSLTASRSPSSDLLHFSRSPTSPAMFNGAQNLRTPFLSRNESLHSQLFGSQLPVFSTPQSTYAHGSLRPAEVSYKQNPPHNRKSAFDFPFLHPECSENVQPSWLQNSSKAGLPPWLLHATLQQNPPISAPQAFSNTAGKHLQHILPRTDMHNVPSKHLSSQVFHSQAQSPPIPVATVLLPRVPEENPSSSRIHMSYRQGMNVKHKMKSKALGIKNSYPCKRTKRLITNPPTIIDLELPEKSVIAGFSSSGDFIDEMQSTSCALDLESSPKQMCGSGCTRSEIHKDGLESFSIESSKVDSGKPGPIKLTAGAKHIIKATQNVDQDTCRPIHSTIPFVAVTNECRDPEPQKKSAKIYKF